MLLGIRPKLKITVKYFYFIACLVLLTGFTGNQSGDATNVQFYSLNNKYGISIRETNEICSDHYGFIWVSSKTGVMRFTEDDYRIYSLPYESADVIRVNLTFSNNRLFTYTNNGQVFRYDELYDRFEPVLNLSRELVNKNLVLGKMLADKNGDLWMASTMGLHVFKNGKISSINEVRSSILYLDWYTDHQFFYTTISGIYLYDTDSGQTKTLHVYASPETVTASKLYYDNESNRLWVGTLSKGLFYLDLNTSTYRKVNINGIPNQPVLAIVNFTASTLLIGIDGQGVWEINKTANRIVNIYKENTDDPTSLKGNGVYDIYCDKNNRVWVCTYSGGVTFFEQKNPFVSQISHVINNPNSLVDNDVNSVIEDRYGKIWFATNNGISCWDVASGRWKTYYHNKKEQAQVFLSVMLDKKDRIWAGTYSSGVYVLDSKTGAELAHYSTAQKSEQYNCDFVFSFFEDSDGDIWIGGVQGDLHCYKTRENRFVSFDDLPAYVISEKEPGKILLGSTYGLIYMDKKTGRSQILVEGQVIRDLYIDQDLIWSCTSGDGLVSYNFKTKETQKYTIESGLTSNFVNSIEYADGFLWLGTENGLCRMNPADKSILAFRSILSYADVSFNHDSHFSLKNGKLIWGTNKGAILFNPSSVQWSNTQGQLYFQDLIISGRSIRDSGTHILESPLDSLKELRLNYNQNTFTLELLPIGVSAAGFKFSWKLEGLDREWSKPSDNRIVTYTNLPSGDFRLVVRMYDSSLSRIIEERELHLHMIPPFWEKWWFRALFIVFILSIASVLVAYYIDRLNKRHSEEKIRFFTNTAHDIRTSLTLINGPIEELHKEENLSDHALHCLDLATEQAQRLSAVVTQLMDFQKVDVGKEKINLRMVDVVRLIHNRVLMFESYAGSRDIQLQFNSNVPNYETAVDETMIERVVDNLISNAVKYSQPQSQVDIALRCISGKWVFEVKDYGIGISKKAQKQLFKEFYRGANAVNSKIVGSGIGLLLVKNYVSLHSGTVNCTSQKNSGSTFQVSIPFREITDQTVKAAKTVNSAPFFPKEIMPQQDNQEQLGSVPSIKVLIVEDHDELRNFLKSSLERYYKVLVASDGKIAWELILDQAPDLVVSDIMMPNMNGFDLCEKMKSTYETSHIPIILLTALAGKAQMLKGLGYGADDYLTKPFDVSLLRQRIKSIVQNREIVREKALKIIKMNDDEPILENELNDKFVKKMVKIVRENIANTQFNKDVFASEMNVSPSLLYKKLKALTDQSPTDFIKSIRLDHSLELLQSRQYTITEISEMCGFTSVGYFSTVFRKHFGKSPTQIT